MLRFLVLMLLVLSASVTFADQSTQNYNYVVPVYRSFCVQNGYGSHFYTTDRYDYRCGQSEWAFNVNVYQDWGLTPLFTCYKFDMGTEQQFLTLDRYCEGQYMGNVLGYVAGQPTQGYSTLYRFASPNPYGYDQIATLNPSEGSRANYRYVGTVGYAPY